MADIEVKIQLQDTVEDSIRVISSPNDVNNASIQKVETAFNRLSVLNDGMNLKSWSTGSLSLADGVVGGADTSLVEQYGYEGYVFGAVPQSKQFLVTIEITGRDIDNIIIYGDKEANQFPTKAYRDSNPNDIIYNNDIDWDITFNDKANTHTITFLEWNRANYNACISHISVKSLSLILGKKWIKNVESLSQSTDRPNEIYYGVLPNSGNLSLVDIDGSLRNYAEEGHFDDANLSIGIFANGKEVKRHISSDSHYDNVARTLEVNLGDNLSNWEELQYKGFAYPKKSENAYNMLLDVFVSIGYTQNQVDKMLSTEIVYGVDNQVGSVKQYLQEITIPYPYLPQASVRETIDKFCTLAQLQVYKTDRNEIKFVSARPLATNLEKTNVIPIEENRMFENFTKAILLKNKYDTVELNAKKIEDKVEYDTIVYAYLNNSLNDFVFKDKKFEGGFYTGASVPIAFKLESFYVSGEAEIYKKSNLGLKEILSVDISGSADTDGFYTLTKKNGTYNFSVNYDTKTGKFKDEKSAFNDIKDPYNTSSKFATTNYYGNVITDTLVETTNGKIPISYSSKSEDSAVNGKTISLSDNSYLKIKDMGEYFLLKYYILARVVYYDLDLAYTTLGGYTGFRGSPRITINEAVNLTVSIYGSKREISFEDNSSDNDIVNNKTVIKISNNELIQEDAALFTTYDNSITKISAFIKDNIKSDYKKGISNATLSVPCLDYYNENGEKVKDWSKGEMLEVHDIIRVQGDNTLWRITGRNFRKQGIPMLDLELQEIIMPPPKKYKIEFPAEVSIYLDSKEILSGAYVEENSAIRINFKSSNGTLISLKNNGIEIVNNSYVYVKQDVNITVEYYTQESTSGTFNFPSSSNQTITVNYNPNSYEVVELIVKNGNFESGGVGGIQEGSWNYPITSSTQTMNYLKVWTNDSGYREYTEVAQISANQNNFYISSLSDSSMFNLEGKYNLTYNIIHKS